VLNPICRPDIADEIMQVSDEDRIDMARKLARMEGISGGSIHV
jgi:cysteine synthase